MCSVIDRIEREKAMCTTVCRACLGRVGLLRIDTLRGYNTQELYEKVTNRKLNAVGGRAATMCFTCVSQLHRYRRLSNTAHRSNSIRQEITMSGVEVTHSNITALNLGTTQHLSVIALPHLTLTDKSNYVSTSVTVKQEQVVKEETTDEGDSIDIEERNKEDVMKDDRSNNEGQCSVEKSNDTNSANKGMHFYCDACNKKYKTKQSLIRHLKVHSNEKPVRCHRTLSYTAHMQNHTAQKRYSCNKCDKSFKRSGDFNRHMLIHTGEKPYVCNKCDKTFRLACNLKRHMFLHTGEKSFVCKICDRGFRQAGHLNRHMLVHTGEKPYVCKICDKTFSQAGNLKQHMNLHTGEKPYVCFKCDKTFRLACTLKQHMIFHTGETPYDCNKCDKTFRHAGDLNRHMLIHTGEKPYVCNKCDKTFRLAGNLKQHMNLHTREKSL